MAAAPAALRGVKVLDLSRVLAGPLCSMLLGDWGADVVKVEVPGTGDDTRLWGPPFVKKNNAKESSYFLSINRNKRSIAVDMKTCAGQQLVRQLACAADVVVENFLPGAASRMKISYDDVGKINPKAVYVSISGYGSSGPLAHHPGYDFMAQAVGGLMHITGAADGRPQKVGVAITDVMTGVLSAGAVCAALQHRSSCGDQGRGQHIEASLLETQVFSLANIASNWLTAGQEAQRLGNAHPSIVPYQTFEAADYEFAVGAGNNKQFLSLCRALALHDLPNDPRFSSNAQRVANRVELQRVLQSLFLQQNAQHWVQLLNSAGVPAQPINNMEKVFGHEQVKARDMVQQYTHPALGVINCVGHPVKFSRTPASIRRPPPMLDEHRAQVLSDWLGMDAAQQQELKQEGAFGP